MASVWAQHTGVTHACAHVWHFRALCEWTMCKVTNARHNLMVLQTRLTIKVRCVRTLSCTNFSKHGANNGVLSHPQQLSFKQVAKYINLRLFSPLILIIPCIALGIVRPPAKSTMLRRARRVLMSPCSSVVRLSTVHIRTE